MGEITQIHKRSELQELARELGVGHDWHEPDNQSVGAFVFGLNFDNAGFWGLRHLSTREYGSRARLYDAGGNTGEWAIDEPERFVEMFVVLYREGKAVAEINLATLFAFACGTYEG